MVPETGVNKNGRVKIKAGDGDVSVMLAWQL